MINKHLRTPFQFIQNSLPFKQFGQLSLKNKLLISFVFVSIIPILLVQTFTFYNSTVTMKKKIDDLIHFNLVETAKNLDTTLTSYEDIVIQILSDDNIVEQVKRLNSGSDIEKLLASIELRKKFSIISLSKPGVKCISVITTTGDVAWNDRDNNSGILNLSIWGKYPDLTKTEIFHDALNSGKVVYVPDSDQYLGREYHYINIALKLSDWKRYNEFLGVVVLSVDEDTINNSCNLSTDNPKGNENYNFIYDRRGRIISFPIEKYFGRQIMKPDTVNSKDEQSGFLLSFIKQTHLFRNRQLIINQHHQEKNGWTIVNVIDQNYLFSQMYWMQRLNVIFSVLGILFSVLIITYVTGAMTRSTHEIVAAMKTARQGELSVQVNLETKDELAMIGSHFNQMMVRIQQLMDEVKLATGREKEAEIRALVAQINPHFLYNMLDSINWMAIEKDEHEISQMIESLAKILRYSINDSNWVVALREEVEWLKQYIYLQQNHFDNSFESHIHFDDEILSYKIYKLLLQPLVENAIIHGFKGYESGGVLKITGTQDGEYIKIVVADNGRGIDSDTLESIDKDMQERYSFSGIGIKNVANRLRVYYGDNAALHFTSEIGQGTTVTLMIPIL